MTSEYLIDSTLRVVARLIATLATVDGDLADLSTIDKRLRNYVARELGPPRNRIALVASAFGVSETSVYAWRRDALAPPETRATDRDWILDFIREATPNPIRRDKLEAHFMAMATKDVAPKGDEDLAESTVASIMNRFETAMWLLRKADLVFATSSGDPLYFAPEPAESVDAAAGIVWLEIFERSSVTPIAHSELRRLELVDDEQLDACLAYLESEGRVERIDHEAEAAFRCTEIYLPLDDQDDGHSLEAAALDHLRLVIDTLIDRFEHRSIMTGRAAERVREQYQSLREEFEARNGMVSWRFELWKGHPLEEEILALGERLVEIAHDLSARARVIEGPKTSERVVYLGMHTRRTASEEDDQ